jgi:MinD superfamily P-loop ATPase
MILSIASGKGGTGKTTVSAALTSIWPRKRIAMDLDVEAPNLHLFLKPEMSGRRNALIEVPKIDLDKCTYCGQCAELCQFKAISVMGTVILTFPEMCHGCGGCFDVCPEGAVLADDRELGEIAWGKGDDFDFLMGRLRIGEAMSPPLMRDVKALGDEMIASNPADIIIDSPPGVSCPAVNAVMDSDVIFLVTEPTPFGVYDLKLAHEAFKPIGKPMGVVVNRAGLGDDSLYDYCRENDLPILSEIPYSRDIAQAYSNGHLITDVSDDFRKQFIDLAHLAMKMAGEKDVPEVTHHA